MKRTLFLFLGAMLAISSLHAQTTVSGNVKATNKPPCKDATCGSYRPTRWPKQGGKQVEAEEDVLRLG